jgi:micrococcal nuclease
MLRDALFKEARFILPLLLLTATTAHAAPGQCRAIDGDSYTCFGERIRLENADTPELHGKCAREIELANSAKSFAQSKLDRAEQIVVSVHERRPRDRYGRTLAKVSVDGDDLGEKLVGEGLARPYHGERRRSWCGQG